MLDLAAVRATVARLALPPDDTLVFGSAPMLLHGLVAEVGDLDLLARGEAWRRAGALGAARDGAAGDRIVTIPDPAGAVDVFDGWMGADVEALFARAERSHGLLFASLEDVLAYKRALDRPKDRAHLRLLERALADRPGRRGLARRDHPF